MSKARGSAVLIVLFSLLAAAQSARAADPSTLVGKVINHPDLQSWMTTLGADPTESILPFRKAYRLSYPKAGVELEFNSNLALYQIVLYDKGSNFNAYEGELPLGLKWGQDSVQIQDKHDYMHPVSNNPYVKYYADSTKTEQFYFVNGRFKFDQDNGYTGLDVQYGTGCFVLLGHSLIAGW